MIRLDRYQRDLIRRELDTDMGGIGDLSIVAEYGNREYLLHLRRKYHEAMWLLDDLGWERVSDRDEFYVTLPVERFRAWLNEASEGLRESIKELSAIFTEGSLYTTDPDELEVLKADRRELIDEYMDREAVCRDVLEAVS